MLFYSENQWLVSARLKCYLQCIRQKILGLIYVKAKFGIK